MKLVTLPFFLIAFLCSDLAMGQQANIIEDVSRDVIWADATPARSCRIVCESVGQGWKAVAGPGTSQKNMPDYVCALKSNGNPGSNNTYSDKASKLCHYQSNGKGHGDPAFSCLCAK